MPAYRVYDLRYSGTTFKQVEAPVSGDAVKQYLEAELDNNQEICRVRYGAKGFIKVVMENGSELLYGVRRVR